MIKELKATEELYCQYRDMNKTYARNLNTGSRHNFYYHRNNEFYMGAIDDFDDFYTPEVKKGEDILSWWINDDEARKKGEFGDEFKY